MSWLRYQSNDGSRFWWHPDDAPPANSTLVSADDGFADGGEPYTDEELYHMEQEYRREQQEG